MTHRLLRWTALALYAVLVPLGVAVRLTVDPLRLRRPPATNWQRVRERPDSLDRARGLG